MNSFPHILSAIATVSIMAITLASCHKEEKGYEDYKSGMVINGVEYHERRPSSLAEAIFWYSKVNPFTRHNDNLGYYYISGGHEELISTDKNNKTKFWFHFTMLVDSLTFMPEESILLDETCSVSRDEIEKMYWSGDIVDVDKYIFSGTLTDWTTNYDIKDGWIRFGEYYRSPYYFACTTFEFTAESSGGEQVQVTQGYIKY